MISAGKIRSMEDIAVCPEPPPGYDRLGFSEKDGSSNWVPHSPDEPLAAGEKDPLFTTFRIFENQLAYHYDRVCRSAKESHGRYTLYAGRGIIGTELHDAFNQCAFDPTSAQKLTLNIPLDEATLAYVYELANGNSGGCLAETEADGTSVVKLTLDSNLLDKMMQQVNEDSASGKLEAKKVSYENAAQLIIKLKEIYDKTPDQIAERGLAENARNFKMQMGAMAVIQLAGLGVMYLIVRPQIQVAKITAKHLAEQNRKVTIDDFATDKVEEMRQKLAADPTFDIVGRDAEAKRAMDVLARTEYANNVVEGDTGPGKDAVIDKIALKIARGDADVPVKLRNKKLWRVDPTDFQAATKWRGTSADKMKLVKDEMQQGNVAYFPELPDQMQAGETSNGGAESLEKMAKEILTKPYSRWIGTGTTAGVDYMMKRVKDMRRRLERQKIDHLPPTDIRQGMEQQVSREYARDKNVTIPADTAEAATRLGIQFFVPEGIAPPYDAAKRALMDAIDQARLGHADTDVVNVTPAHVVSGIEARLGRSIDPNAGRNLFAAGFEAPYTAIIDAWKVASGGTPATTASTSSAPPPPPPTIADEVAKVAAEAVARHVAVDPTVVEAAARLGGFYGFGRTDVTPVDLAKLALRQAINIAATNPAADGSIAVTSEHVTGALQALLQISINPNAGVAPPPPPPPAPTLLTPDAVRTMVASQQWYMDLPSDAVRDAAVVEIARIYNDDLDPDTRALFPLDADGKPPVDFINDTVASDALNRFAPPAARQPLTHAKAIDVAEGMEWYSELSSADGFVAIDTAMRLYNDPVQDYGRDYPLDADGRPPAEFFQELFEAGLLVRNRSTPPIPTAIASSLVDSTEPPAAGDRDAPTLDIEDKDILGAESLVDPLDPAAARATPPPPLDDPARRLTPPPPIAANANGVYHYFKTLSWFRSVGDTAEQRLLSGDIAAWINTNPDVRARVVSADGGFTTDFSRLAQMQFRPRELIGRALADLHTSPDRKTEIIDKVERLLADPDQRARLVTPEGEFIPTFSRTVKLAFAMNLAVVEHLQDLPWFRATRSTTEFHNLNLVDDVVTWLAADAAAVDRHINDATGEFDSTFSRTVQLRFALNTAVAEHLQSSSTWYDRLDQARKVEIVKQATTWLGEGTNAETYIRDGQFVRAFESMMFSRFQLPTVIRAALDATDWFKQLPSDACRNEVADAARRSYQTPSARRTHFSPDGTALASLTETIRGSTTTDGIVKRHETMQRRALDSRRDLSEAEIREMLGRTDWFGGLDGMQQQTVVERANRVWNTGSKENLRRANPLRFLQDGWQFSEGLLAEFKRRSGDAQTMLGARGAAEAASQRLAEAVRRVEDSRAQADPRLVAMQIAELAGSGARSEDFTNEAADLIRRWGALPTTEAIEFVSPDITANKTQDPRELPTHFVRAVMDMPLSPIAVRAQMAGMSEFSGYAEAHLQEIAEGMARRYNEGAASIRATYPREGHGVNPGFIAEETRRIVAERGPAHAAGAAGVETEDQRRERLEREARERTDPIRGGGR